VLVGGPVQRPGRRRNLPDKRDAHHPEEGKAVSEKEREDDLSLKEPKNEETSTAGKGGELEALLEKIHAKTEKSLPRRNHQRQRGLHLVTRPRP